MRIDTAKINLSAPIKGDMLRRMAAELRDRSRESFERCDTDGFLSQRSDDLMARKYELEADIADNDGLAKFETLADSETGQMIPCRLMETKYGMAWALFDSFEDALVTTGKVRGWCGTGDKALAKHALKPLTVIAPAYVEMVGSNINMRPVIMPNVKAFTPANCSPAISWDEISNLPSPF